MTHTAFSQDYSRSFNRFTPVERASSHGNGVNLGSGIEQIQVQNPSQETDDIQYKTATRAWITKGVFWPLDMGLGIATLDEQQSLSAYMQYTLYEAFMTPAVALRATHSQLTQSQLEPLNSSTVQLVGSWGYRIVSLWGSIGYTLHQQKSLPEPEGEWVRDVGLYLHVLPPYIAISAELKTAQYSPQSRILKLSVGI